MVAMHTHCIVFKGGAMIVTQVGTKKRVFYLQFRRIRWDWIQGQVEAPFKSCHSQMPRARVALDIVFLWKTAAPYSVLSDVSDRHIHIYN